MTPSTVKVTSDQLAYTPPSATASRRRRQRRRVISVSLLLGPTILLLLVALSGCGGVKMPDVKIPEPEPPPPPTRLILEIKASSGLNPNPNGNAAPLVVRIYELANTGRFTSTGFQSLYQDDRSTLGSDMVGRNELLLRPGARQTVEKTLNPGVSAIGVLGAYRNLDGVRWRATIPIVPETDNRLTLTLGARELTLAPSE